MSLYLVPILPLFAALFCAIPRSERWAPALTFATALAALAASLFVGAAVLAGGRVVAMPHWIEVDAFSALLLVLIATVSLTAALFSWGYISRYVSGPRLVRIYYANFNLFVVSMLVIPIVDEPGLAWIAVELTTLLSIFLVSFENSRDALEAAWKYMVLTLVGATIAVLGFLVLFWAMESVHSTDFTWEGLRALAPRMSPPLLTAAFLLILIGFGTKVGLVPLHTWLPDAHSQAPSPVCALLSGIETTAVLYVIVRLLPIFAASPRLHADEWALAFGLVSVGAAAFLIVQTHDYKRLFAFSTVEHMGIILTAAAMGGSLASYGTVWQILSHAVTKSFCFYAAGAVLLLTGSREIASVRGLAERSRLTATALLIGALAISGAPPFAVFASEFTIFRAGIAQGQYLVVGLLALFIVIAFCGVLLHANRMVFGAPLAAHPSPLGAGGGLPVACVASLLVAAVPVVVLGFAIPWPLHMLLREAAVAVAR